jgi:hypothetical protein
MALDRNCVNKIGNHNLARGIDNGSAVVKHHRSMRRVQLPAVRGFVCTDGEEARLLEATDCPEQRYSVESPAHGRRR